MGRLLALEVTEGGGGVGAETGADACVSLTKTPIVIVNCVHAVGCPYLRSHGQSSSIARSS